MVLHPAQLEVARELIRCLVLRTNPRAGLNLAQVTTSCLRFCLAPGKSYRRASGGDAHPLDEFRRDLYRL